MSLSINRNYAEGINRNSILGLQGAAFDLPEEVAEMMMLQKEELTKRDFTLDKPTSLPLETGNEYGGGGGGRRYGGGGGGYNQGGYGGRQQGGGSYRGRQSYGGGGGGGYNNSRGGGGGYQQR